MDFNEDGHENVESGLSEKRKNIQSIEVNEFPKDKKEEEQK